VLLDIVARALLVVRNALMQAAGDRADKVRGSFVYKAFLDWPLRALAALAGGLRRAPSTQRAVIVAALLYAVISGVVVAKTAPGYGSLAAVPTWGAALFVGLPILLLAAAGFLISVRSDDSKPVRSGRALWALVKAVGAATAVGVLVALWLTPSDQLCGRVLGGLWDACPSWLQTLTTAGKVVLSLGAVLTAPFARAAVGLSRKR
jgi:hypothetical protein